MEREEVEERILEHVRAIIALATEYGSTGVLNIAFVPNVSGGIYWVYNEYWSPRARAPRGGQDQKHPINASRLVSTSSSGEIK